VPRGQLAPSNGGGPRSVVVTPNVRRAVGGTVNQRHLKRNRKFVDSPQEGNGFELSVPRCPADSAGALIRR